MAGEIKPLFDDEALKQLEAVNGYLSQTKALIGDMNKIKFNTNSFTQAGKEGQKTKTVVDELTKAQQNLAKAQSDGGKELVKLKSETARVNAETRKQAKAVADGTLIYNQQREELIQLQNKAKELGVTYGVQSQQFIQASDKARNLAEKLREVDQATGDNRSSVGNYRQEIEKALNSSGVFGAETRKLSEVFTSFSRVSKEITANLTNYYTQLNQNKVAATENAVAQEGMAAGTALANTATTAQITLLQRLKIALIATGIGAFVVAVTALSAAFLSTQRGADALLKVLEPIKALFSASLGVIQELSFSLVDTFQKKPKEIFKAFANLLKDQVINRVMGAVDVFKGLGDVIAGVFSADTDRINKGLKEAGNGALQIATGIKDAGDRLVEFSAKNIAIGKQIAASKIEQEKLENALIKKQDEREEREKELELITKNTANSIEQKKNALDEILKLTQEQADDEKLILKEKEKQLILQQSLNDTKRQGTGSDEELLKLQEEIGDLDERILEKKKENIRVISQIQKEEQKGAADRQKAEDERLARLREITANERELLKIKFEQQKSELGLNKEITKLTELEQQALAKITSEYEKQLALLDQKTEATIIQRVGALQKESTELINNITLLSKYKEAASPEQQQAINDEITEYSNRLRDVNTELTTLGGLTKDVLSINEQFTTIANEQTQLYADLFTELDNQYKNGTLSADQYYNEVLDLQKRFADDSIKGVIDLSNLLVQNGNLTASERIEIEKRVNDAKQKLREKDLANIKKNNDEEVAEEKAKEEKKKQIQNLTLDFVDTAVTGAFDIFKAKNEQELSEFKALQNEKQEYLNQLLEQGAITQEEYIARKSALEVSAARQEAQIKAKTARQEKAQALFSIAINTARAIIAALPNVALAAIIGSMGALQAAFVAAKPIPKFAKGVKNFEGGLAEIGERGRELVKLPSGETFLTPHAMKTFLPKGTDVFSNPQTEKMLRDESLPYLKEIRDRLSNRPIVNVNIKNSSNYVNWYLR